MTISKIGAVKKRPGRPATGRDPVTAIRLSEAMRRDLDTWRRKQDDLPSRSEAIRRLVEKGLAHQPLEPGKPHKGAERAKEMALEVMRSKLAGVPERRENRTQSAPHEKAGAKAKRLIASEGPGSR